jgi:hypothetical protein
MLFVRPKRSVAICAGRRVAETVEDDLSVYAYYRSKKSCEQAVAEADAIIRGMLGELAKESKETHPDLNKYR